MTSVVEKEILSLDRSNREATTAPEFSTLLDTCPCISSLALSIKSIRAILQRRKDKQLQDPLAPVLVGPSMIDTHIVGGCDRDAILERMPAHVEYLLVKVNLIGIRLLLHP